MNYPLVEQESDSESKSNDRIIDIALKELSNLTPLKYVPFDGELFHTVYTKVSETFTVRKSSITTRMARLLYSISLVTKPKNVLVIGSALANALIWLAIPVLNTAENIVGVDLNQKNNEKSLANLKRYGTDTVQLLTMNGLDLNHILTPNIDLLFIDVYSETDGKSQYVDILENVYGLLKNGSVLLAHDISYPKFIVDLAPYLAIVRDRSRFQSTCTMKIDRYGLEVSIR